MATQFSFRLQSLLNWKKSLEESSQMRLGKKTRELRVVEEEIQKLIQQRFESDQTLQQKMRTGIQMGEYLMYKWFGEDSYQDLLEREGKKQHRLREVARERELLTGLMKERKTLEKLKEKGAKRFIDQMEELDQKNLDERVIQSHRAPGGDAS